MAIQEDRRKAIALLEKHGNEGDTLGIDYLIDDECRQAFKLPPRPLGSQPYVGWMVGGKEDNSPPDKISAEGVALIKRWEGMAGKAYLCPAGVWTIGYGHTKGVQAGQVISPFEADELLKEDLKIYEMP